MYTLLVLYIRVLSIIDEEGNGISTCLYTRTSLCEERFAGGMVRLSPPSHNGSRSALMGDCEEIAGDKPETSFRM
jgi:hypothetical protein